MSDFEANAADGFVSGLAKLTAEASYSPGPGAHASRVGMPMRCIDEPKPPDPSRDDLLNDLAAIDAMDDVACELYAPGAGPSECERLTVEARRSDLEAKPLDGPELRALAEWKAPVAV